MTSRQSHRRAERAAKKAVALQSTNPVQAARSLRESLADERLAFRLATESGAPLDTRATMARNILQLQRALRDAMPRPRV